MTNYHKFRDKFVKLVRITCVLCSADVLELRAVVAESQVFVRQQFMATKAMHSHMREMHPGVHE